MAAPVRREGAKGHRWYDWAWITIPGAGPGCRWLLIRRSRRTGELAFYRCYCPHRVPLGTLVKVAGLRWTTEENFQAGKGLAGLDEHQVRHWTPWYRWVTLAMLALAFLSVAAATEHAQPSPPQVIPLTRNEIARLFTGPAHPGRTRWSIWRRHHQYNARACHYHRNSRAPIRYFNVGIADSAGAAEHISRATTDTRNSSGLSRSRGGLRRRAGPACGSILIVHEAIVRGSTCGGAIHVTATRQTS